MRSYLTELGNGDPLIRFGRSIRDGYARGWGLQFGDLAKKVAADPMFQKAMSISGNRTVVSDGNRMNLYLIIAAYLSKLPFGHIIEFGTYRGGTAFMMAYLAKQLLPGVKVYALDSFEGMPETDRAIDAHGKGDFADVDLAEMRQHAQRCELDNLVFVKGLFEQTTEAVLAEAKSISLAHIDCDIYSAVAYSYEMVKPVMVPGGYLVFDDATYSSCLGATEAVESLLVRRDGLNSEQISPQFVFRYPQVR